MSHGLCLCWLIDFDTKRKRTQKSHFFFEKGERLIGRSVRPGLMPAQITLEGGCDPSGRCGKPVEPLPEDVVFHAEAHPLSDLKAPVFPFLMTAPILYFLPTGRLISIPSLGNMNV